MWPYSLAAEVSNASSTMLSASTQWQFKYKHDDIGVQELMEKTGVFVNSAILSSIKRVATGQKVFARALLDAVFTQEALNKCSLTGSLAKGIGKDKSEATRPGLDANAVAVILSKHLRYLPIAGIQNIVSNN